MTLYYDDNMDAMSNIESESIDLIYCDPPFFTQREWGEFDDRWDGIQTYISWLRIRMYEMKRLLKRTGSIYVQCDWHASHYIKVMMDDVFGYKNFNSDIIWKRCNPKGNAKMYANSIDNILFYSKDHVMTAFNIQYGGYSEATLKMLKYDDHDGRGRYGSDNISAPGGKGYKYSLGYDEKCPPGGYRWKEETMLQKIEDGRVIIKRGKVPRQKRYESDCKGVPFDNVWVDIENVKSPTYPTEKPEELLERIIKSSSNPGDIVLDPFCGSGTTCAVAKKLNRKYVGIDNSPRAIDICMERLAKIPRLDQKV